jgi:hypothetical protein
MESASLSVRPSAETTTILRPLVVALAAALTLVVLYLLARRLSGALVAPLDFVPALALGLLIAFGTWSMRQLALGVVPEQPKLLVGICAMTWLLVAGLTLSGTSPLAGLALWLPVIATEAYWRVVPPDVVRLAGDQTARREERPSPSEVVQQFTRTREEGCEQISGIVRMEFAAGEQTAAQHVAFCPPLQSDPEVEIEAVALNDVTVRAAECRSYGLRLEGRRGRDTAQPLTVLVSFEAAT